MEKLREAIRIILIMKGFVYLFLPLVIWIRYPELSQMEVFLNSWFLIIISSSMFFLSCFLVKKRTLKTK